MRQKTVIQKNYKHSTEHRAILEEMKEKQLSNLPSTHNHDNEESQHFYVARIILGIEMVFKITC